MKQLVMIHGRSQQDKDSVKLKDTWIEAWEKGLDKNGLKVPLPKDQIRFPYYGDTLRDMVEGVSVEEAARIIVRGAASGAAAQAFIAAVLSEYTARLDISSTAIERNLDAPPGPQVIERGLMNWSWVQAILRTIDQNLPGGAQLIAIATNDVYQYLYVPRLRRHIEDGVLSAFDGEGESVVVSHSLGTVVAYTALHRLEMGQNRKIPLLVTLGSPLGINAIGAKLAPIAKPGLVREWFNARDPNDVVSLFPLDAQHFPVTPSIENKNDVDNWTENQHGIAGYLDDKEVALKIYNALCK